MLNPTGGLIYHGRALLYRRSLWRDFREEVCRWLCEWAPPEGRALLVGPSAGYCLDRRFLARFERVAAVEPDPLARALFGSRFRIRAAWDKRNYFSSDGRSFDAAGIDRLLANYPDHAVLFCNFLGQLRFLDGKAEAAALDPSFTVWKAALIEALSSRSWASFHDRLSGPLAPTGLGPSERGLGGPELIERFYRTPGQGRGRIELLDHLTGDLAPELPRHYFCWQLRPGTFHLIEGIFHRGDPQSDR